MGRVSDKIPPEIRHQATEWMFALQAAPEDGALRQRIDEWIAQDPAHARAWHVAGSAWRMTGQVRFDQELYDRVVEARAASRKSRPIGGVFRIPVFLGSLAAAALLFLAWPEIRNAALADYSTRTAQMREVALDDGSIVNLAPGSAIAVDFRKESRTLALLRGEAFFRVAHDAARPFSVRADDLSVTVTGTSFDVNMTDQAFAVSVASGSVRVARGGQSVGAQSAELTTDLAPGQRLVIDRRSDRTVRSSVPEAEVAPWRSGQLILRDTSMAEAVDAIARFYFGAIVITDGELKARRVTGVFNLDDPVCALRLLTEAYGGTVREMTPFLVLISRS